MLDVFLEDQIIAEGNGLHRDVLAERPGRGRGVDRGVDGGAHGARRPAARRDATRRDETRRPTRKLSISKLAGPAAAMPPPPRWPGAARRPGSARLGPLPRNTLSFSRVR